MDNLQKSRRDVIGARFRTAMIGYLKDNHMTQTQLAKNSGLSRAVISNIMAGHQPSFEVAVILSRTMGMSLDAIERGNIIDIVDPSQFKELFKKDVVEEVQRAVDRSDVYGKDMTELTDEQKKTIMRLIRAYLNLNLNGSKRKK